MHNTTIVSKNIVKKIAILIVVAVTFISGCGVNVDSYGEDFKDAVEKLQNASGEISYSLVPLWCIDTSKLSPDEAIGKWRSHKERLDSLESGFEELESVRKDIEKLGRNVPAEYEDQYRQLERYLDLTDTIYDYVINFEFKSAKETSEKAGELVYARTAYINYFQEMGYID